MIQGTTNIPDNLAKYGKIGMSNKQLTQKVEGEFVLFSHFFQMGELFQQRCSVNLHTDILDTPDIFWNYDAFENVYLLVR